MKRRSPAASRAADGGRGRARPPSSRGTKRFEMCASEALLSGCGARAAGRRANPADQVAPGVRDEAASLGERLAQMLEFSFERRRGPARRRERRVVLDALENASGERLGVGEMVARRKRIESSRVTSTQYLAQREQHLTVRRRVEANALAIRRRPKAMHVDRRKGACQPPRFRWKQHSAAAPRPRADAHGGVPSRGRTMQRTLGLSAVSCRPRRSTTTARSQLDTELAPPKGVTHRC